MSPPPLGIRGTGMVSGVGLSAPACCAAIRAAIDNFQETRFIDAGGEWIIGSMVPLEKPWRGIAKLARMLALALGECTASTPQLRLDDIPVLLCLAEPQRPGRPTDMGQRAIEETGALLGTSLNPRSRVIEQGHVSLVTALHQARRLLVEDRLPRVIIAGVDSLLSAPTLRELEEKDHLLTSQNSDGFIPGEAAAAVLVELARPDDAPQLQALGIGWAEEKATPDSELPLRADGLVQAIKAALQESGWNLGAIDFRMTDLSGDQYAFKEAALALTRLLRQRKEELDIWHPADCIGEVGAAIGPVMLTVLSFAMQEGFSPGPNVLCHLGNDDGKRSAIVLTYRPVKAA
jgi:3-oxoacyl-[acyl-carrier-protein] synthase-1